MLSVLGRLLRLGRDFAVERNRASGHADFPRRRMVETHDVPVYARLLAGEHLLISQHLCREDIRRSKLIEPLASALLRKDPIKYRFNFTAMKIAHRIVGAFGILLDMLDSHDAAEIGPALVVDARETYVAVAGAKRAPHAMKERMATAGTLRLFVGHCRIVNLESLGRDHRAEDRRVDALTFARAFAGE